MHIGTLAAGAMLAMAGTAQAQDQTWSFDAEFSETYPAVNGGLSVGYDVSRNDNLYLAGQWYLTIAGEEDTAVLAPASPPPHFLGSSLLEQGLEGLPRGGS